MNAFYKWLLLQPREEAVKYIIECLMLPNSDMAWGLMAEFNGDYWRVPMNDFPKFINETLDKLEAKKRKES